MTWHNLQDRRERVFAVCVERLAAQRLCSVHQCSICHVFKFQDSSIQVPTSCILYRIKREIANEGGKALLGVGITWTT